ncbi:MAG: precorrin-6y C5,15-methyltransferase (decarboxylating) subunit CbiE [Pseudomonadota bacterium]
MSDPWLTLIGLTDDSVATLPHSTQRVLAEAEMIFGAERHLDLVNAGTRGRAWPHPFSVEPVLDLQGHKVVVLASGDPFWFGVGGSLAAHLSPNAWTVLPAASTFSLVAAALGWRLEDVGCYGLHAAPFARMRGALAPGGRYICLMRDGASPAAFAEWLTDQGAGMSRMIICERLGGPHQRIRETLAQEYALTDVAAPLAVAVALPARIGLSRASGLPDDHFQHDGQITKRPIRALTLSALAPQPGLTLWDIGAGSGSISIEWCLTGGRAIAFERDAMRANNIRVNAAAFGVDHLLQVIEGAALQTLPQDPLPDAVFVGGGASSALFDALFQRLPSGTRLVVNAVTLETEAHLVRLQAERGGKLLRIDLAQAKPLGPLRGWQPMRPIVQWEITL